MQRFSTCVVALALACASAAAAQKATTPDDLDKAMKRLAAAQQAATKAVRSKAWDEARARVAAARQALVDAEQFWVVSRNDDALKLSRDAVSRMAGVEKALGAAAPDDQAVMAAFREVAASCAGCHKAYRTQDENQQYVLKEDARANHAP